MIFISSDIQIFPSASEKSDEAKINQIRSFIDRLRAELDEKVEELETLKSEYDQQEKQEQENKVVTTSFLNQHLILIKISICK